MCIRDSGNVGDWAEIETQELVVESSNSNIDLEAVAVLKTKYIYQY